MPLTHASFLTLKTLSSTPAIHERLTTRIPSQVSRKRTFPARWGSGHSDAAAPHPAAVGRGAGKRRRQPPAATTPIAIDGSRHDVPEPAPSAAATRTAAAWPAATPAPAAMGAAAAVVATVCEMAERSRAASACEEEALQLPRRDRSCPPANGVPCR